MRVARHLAVAGVLAVLSTSCQVRVLTDVDLAAGGSGDVEVAVTLDAELTQLLEQTGIELLRGIDAVREDDTTWKVEGGPTDDGGVAVRLHASFDRPDELDRLVDELHASLDEDDVRLFDRLEVHALAGGAVRFDGEIGLRLPVAPGIRGRGIEVDRADVQRWLREHPETVVYDVRVTLPAAPIEHDADEVDGRTVTWHAPVGEVRVVSATSDEPAGLPLLVYVAGAVAVAVVAAVAWSVVRRSG